MTLIDERPVARARAAEAPECDVAIIGAGPYGLSAAAHLGATDGLDVRVFGQPMSFWERHMPAGMLLRSPWSRATSSDPGGALHARRYRDDTEQPFGSPVPLDRFVDYGRWFQRQAVPGLDRRTVPARRRRTATGSSSSSRTASRSRARRVVVAAGIAPFAQRPPLFDTLPPELVSHAVEHRDLRPFDGRRVVVVGGGQSALESAALLHEAGADVEVVVRERDMYWLTRALAAPDAGRVEHALRAGRRRPGRRQPARRAARALAAASARAPGPPGAPRDPAGRRRVARPAPARRPDHGRASRSPARRRPTAGSGSG